MKLTPTQRELARHALGLPNDRKQSYRNRFIASEGHADFAEWEAMVATGAAMVCRAVPLYAYDDAFWMTPEGAKAALAKGESLDPEDFPS